MSAVSHDGPHWLEFGRAEFDAAMLPAKARKAAAAQDEPALFFMPRTGTAKPSKAAGQMPGQADLFGDLA